MTKNVLGAIAVSFALSLTGVANAGGPGDCTGNPADINADGTLDIQDVLAFIDAVINDDAAADLDGSGSFDLADVQLFIESFLTGC